MPGKWPTRGKGVTPGEVFFRRWTSACAPLPGPASSRMLRSPGRERQSHAHPRSDARGGIELDRSPEPADQIATHREAQTAASARAARRKKGLEGPRRDRRVHAAAPIADLDAQRFRLPRPRSRSRRPPERWPEARCRRGWRARARARRRPCAAAEGRARAARRRARRLARSPPSGSRGRRSRRSPSSLSAPAPGSAAPRNARSEARISPASVAIVRASRCTRSGSGVRSCRRAASLSTTPSGLPRSWTSPDPTRPSVAKRSATSSWRARPARCVATAVSASAERRNARCALEYGSRVRERPSSTTPSVSAPLPSRAATSSPSPRSPTQAGERCRSSSARCSRSVSPSCCAAASALAAASGAELPWASTSRQPRPAARNTQTDSASSPSRSV